MNKASGLPWSSRNLVEKIATVVGLLISAAVLVLAVLTLLGILPRGGDIYIPLLSVLMLAQCVRDWRSQRAVAVFSLMVALFIAGIVVFRFVIL